MDIAHRLRVLKARAQARRGFFRFLSALKRHEVDEVWVGDSHAVLLNTARFPFPTLAPTEEDERRWVWHMGPRLMFSISREGFDPVMMRWARLLRPERGSAEPTWFFVFGEIDVRCHLVPRLTAAPQMPFVARYVEQVRRFADRVGIDKAVVVVPIPPAVDVLDHSAFPVVGTPEQRLSAHRTLREHLIAVVAASGDARLRVVDATDVLAGPDDLLSEEFTDDGCHTNLAGRAAFRHAVDSSAPG